MSVQSMRRQKEREKKKEAELLCDELVSVWAENWAVSRVLTAG